MHKTNMSSTILGGCWHKKGLSVYLFRHPKCNFLAFEYMQFRREKMPANYFLRMFQFSEKIDNNILSPNLFNPKLTRPKLYQTERNQLAHLLSFASLFSYNLSSLSEKALPEVDTREWTCFPTTNHQKP